MTTATKAGTGKTIVGALMPTPQAQALKDLAWQRRTTVSELIRTSTASLLAQAQQEGGAS